MTPVTKPLSTVEGLGKGWLGSTVRVSDWPQSLPWLSNHQFFPDPYPSPKSSLNRLPDAAASRFPWQNEFPAMTAALSERKPATEEISGLIERVTFHNQESGLCPVPGALCAVPEDTGSTWRRPRSSGRCPG